MKQHIILCGFGHVGYRCFRLLSRFGISIAVIYDHVQVAWLRELEEYGAICLSGDARDPSLLKQAGVERASAVIVVTDQDLVNISVAIDARALNPNVRLVVRLFDQLLASRLKELLCIEHAFSSSYLAGPIFSSAALGHVILGSTRLGEASVALTLGSFGGLRDAIKRGLCQCLLMEGESGNWIEFDLNTVSEVTRIISLRHLEFQEKKKKTKRNFSTSEAGDTPPEVPPSHRSILHRRQSCTRFFSSMPVEIRFILACLLGMLLLSLLVFHFEMNMSYLDSLYFAVTIFTSTGFGDFSFAQTSWPVKLFGVFAMLCGTALLATVVGVVQDLIISARLRELLQKREIPQHGHHILVGFGSLGFRIAETLKELGENFLVIDIGENDRLLDAQRSHIPLIKGDARNPDVLVKSNIAGAKSLLTLSEDPLFNLGVALLGKAQHPGITTVLRSFDAALGEKLKESLHLDAVLSMSAVAAPSFVAAALYPTAKDAFLCENSLLVILEGEQITEEWMHKNVPRVRLRVSGPRIEVLQTIASESSDSQASLYSLWLLPLEQKQEEVALKPKEHPANPTYTCRGG